MKKKGDLSLSMNAIVILILAITLLGLGLTFMRGLFKTMTSKVQEAVSAQELVSPPTEDTQLTVAPSEFNLRSGSAAKAVVAFMSTDPATSGVQCTLGPCTCKVGTASSCTIDDPIYNADTAFTMMKGQINTWTVVVQSPTGLTDPCTGLCSCSMSCSGGAAQQTYGKDFMVTWTP